MRTAVRARLLGIALSGMLALAAFPANATYKCVENNQTTYSTDPCKGSAQAVKEVKNEVSVTPAYVPPEGSSSGSGRSLGKLGLDAKDVITIVLLALVPISLVTAFFMSRKSKSVLK